MFFLIAIAAMFYFVGGASVGALIYHIAHGQFHRITHEDLTMTWMLLLNLLLLPCLVALWRHRETDEEAEVSMSASSSVADLRRIPINKRIAFLVFASVWVIGVAVVFKFGP